MASISNTFISAEQCFERGSTCFRSKPQRLPEAHSWFLQAAELGHARAQANLGSMYIYGQGCNKDVSLGKQWYVKAANQGNEAAIAMLKNYEESFPQSGE